MPTLLCFGSSLSLVLAQSFCSNDLPTNLRNGFSCREDDESEALGAELLREAAGIRQQDALGKRVKEER
jgi:hypothetical protein